MHRSPVLLAPRAPLPSGGAACARSAASRQWPDDPPPGSSDAAPSSSAGALRATCLLAVGGLAACRDWQRAGRSARGAPLLAVRSSRRSTGVLEVLPPREAVEDEAERAPKGGDGKALPGSEAVGKAVEGEAEFASKSGSLDEAESGLDVDLDNLPPGVTCAVSGQAVICTMSEEYLDGLDSAAREEKEVSTFDYVWPRALLLGCSLLYGTNFPLGKVMNAAFPASAAALLRFGLAALALSPFLTQLKPSVARPAIECGFFVAMGYIGQAIALETEPASTVGFICALAVVWCPLLESVVDKKPVGANTWVAAGMAIAGVFLLELGPDGGITPSWGDAWALLQCVGFGTAFWRTEKMMARNPDQTLPITAAQVAVAAAASFLWFLLDGGDVWNIFASASAASAGAASPDLGPVGAALGGILPAGAPVAAVAAVAWTGLVTTALNRLGETASLGRMSSSEATVLLCTEPIWASVFAVYLLSEQLGANAIAGGALITVACLVNSLGADIMPKQEQEGAKAKA